MLDPRLNDLGLTEQERSRLAAAAGLIPADHPQLWKDSDLHRAAARAYDLSRLAATRHLA